MLVQQGISKMAVVDAWATALSCTALSMRIRSRSRSLDSTERDVAVARRPQMLDVLEIGKSQC